MDTTVDFYETLGVDRKATPDEIKKAYRKAARKYHPDVNPGDKEAEETYKGISQAFEVLSDPEKRSKYDQFGTAWQQAQQGGQWSGGDFGDFVYTNFGAGSFEDIFGSIFGGVRSAEGRHSVRTEPRQERGPNITHDLGITLAEAVTGTNKQLTLSIADRCPECDGLGGKGATCGTCGGTGQGVRTGGLFSIGGACPQCHGSGEVIQSQCPKCRGGGEALRERKLKVTIPAGVKSGSKIRLAKEGGRGRRGGSNGDLILLINVEEHPFFKRTGDDIEVDVPISFNEAALGDTISVPTVQGTVNLRIPPGTKSGQRFRLKGQGPPKPGAKTNSDQFVTTTIVPPRRITAEQRELLEEFQRVTEEDPRADVPDSV